MVRRQALLEKLANVFLVIISMLIGLVALEPAYRGIFEWRENSRWKRPSLLWLYSTSVWDFDTELGYSYRPHARMDWTILENGIPRRCGTFVTGSVGSPGKGVDVSKLGDVKFIALGDSFTAWVQQGETWPDILSGMLENQTREPTPILNLARDGFGVLQMFDQAAHLVRVGYRPDAFMISIIGPDLVRARIWKMTFERNGAIEYFVSTVPSLDISPETHARSGFIDSRITRAWCETLRSAGQTDETAEKIGLAFDATRRADEAFFRPRLNWFSFTDCYLCNRVRFGHPVKGLVRVTGNPEHMLTRFQDDARFSQDLAIIRASGVPIWVVYLPYGPELRNARKQMTARELSLLNSLKAEADRFIDLTPDTPLGDATEPLTMLPEDSHPSHAGLEYYAREVYRQIMQPRDSKRSP
jgi:hypothetical protein